MLSPAAREKRSRTVRGVKRPNLAASLRASPHTKGRQVSSETRKKLSIAGKKHWEKWKTDGSGHAQEMLDAIRASLARRRGPEHRALLEALGPEAQGDVPLEIDGHTIFADELLPSSKLIVEIDGPDHAHRQKRLADKARDQALHGLGYSVLRFWRWDVEEKLPEVLAQIRSTTSK